MKLLRPLAYAFLASYRQHISLMIGLALLLLFRHPIPTYDMVRIIAAGIGLNTLWTFADGLLFAHREYKAAKERVHIVQKALSDAMNQNRPPPN